MRRALLLGLLLSVGFSPARAVPGGVVKLPDVVTGVAAVVDGKRDRAEHDADGVTLQGKHARVTGITGNTLEMTVLR